VRAVSGLLVDPLDGVYPGILRIEADRIVSVERTAKPEGELHVFPGFVDLQVYDSEPLVRSGVTDETPCHRRDCSREGEIDSTKGIQRQFPHRDVAILELVEAQTSFVDTRNNKREGKLLLKPVQTVINGVPFGRPYQAPFAVR